MHFMLIFWRPLSYRYYYHKKIMPFVLLIPLYLKKLESILPRTFQDTWLSFHWLPITCQMCDTKSSKFSLHYILILLYFFGVILGWENVRKR